MLTVYCTGSWQHNNCALRTWFHCSRSSYEWILWRPCCTKPWQHNTHSGRVKDVSVTIAKISLWMVCRMRVTFKLAVHQLHWEYADRRDSSVVTKAACTSSAFTGCCGSMKLTVLPSKGIDNSMTTLLMVSAAPKTTQPLFHWLALAKAAHGCCC